MIASLVSKVIHAQAFGLQGTHLSQSHWNANLRPANLAPFQYSVNLRMNTASEARQKGWYHGWNIVVVCVLSQAAANGLAVNAFSLFLHDWSIDLEAPISSLQIGLAALGLFSAVFSPFVGGLADKYPARWLLGSGSLGIALFCFAVSFVETRWQLLALYALLLPVALTLATALPANAVISRWFVRRLGLALGLSAFGLGAAGVILPPVVAALMPEFGWRTIWRSAGVIVALVVAPLVIWIVRDRPTERDGLHYLAADARHVHAHTHAGSGTGSLRWRDILGRTNFRLLVATYLPMLALYGGCLNNLAPIATSRGLTQQTAGILLSLFSLSHVSSTLVAGILSDRFGNRIPLFGLAMGTAIGGVVVALCQDVVSLAVGVVLVAMSGGMWPLLAAAVAKEFGAFGVGRAFGLLMMFLPVIGLSPFAIAKIQELTTSYTPGLLALAALTLGGALACLFIREQQGWRTDKEPAASKTDNEVLHESIST